MSDCEQVPLSIGDLVEIAMGYGLSHEDAEFVRVGVIGGFGEHPLGIPFAVVYAADEEPLSGADPAVACWQVNSHGIRFLEPGATPLRAFQEV